MSKQRHGLSRIQSTLIANIWFSMLLIFGAFNFVIVNNIIYSSDWLPSIRYTQYDRDIHLYRLSNFTPCNIVYDSHILLGSHHNVLQKFVFLRLSLLSSLCHETKERKEKN